MGRDLVLWNVVVLMNIYIPDWGNAANLLI